MTNVRAWHFLEVPRKGSPPRLGYDDGRAVVVGETLTVERPGDIMPCNYGLHASKDILDALTFEKGAWCCLVKLSGRVIACPNGDKHVASERTVLAMADVTAALAAWNRWALTRLLDLGWPDAPEVVRTWVATDGDGAGAEDAAITCEGEADENTVRRDIAGRIYRIIPLDGRRVKAYELARRIVCHWPDDLIPRDELRADLLARVLPLLGMHREIRTDG